MAACVDSWGLMELVCVGRTPPLRGRTHTGGDRRDGLENPRDVKRPRTQKNVLKDWDGPMFGVHERPPDVVIRSEYLSLLKMIVKEKKTPGKCIDEPVTPRDHCLTPRGG